MNNKEKHRLYSIFVDSYGKSLNSGSSVMQWAENMQKLGIIFQPELKNMMLCSLGYGFIYHQEVATKKKIKNKKGYVSLRSNVFGEIYFPEELALKILALKFLPIK